MRVNAGAAAVDITPPDGLEMAGFAARCQGAEGRHDNLSARALVIGDTGLAALDVLGVDRAMAVRIRKRAELPEDRIVVAATHTHGGPASMTSMLTSAPDPDWLAKTEDAAVEALNRAKAASAPARLLYGAGRDPGAARNRRRTGGPADLTLPVMAVEGEDGTWIAVLASAALHPVVLGAGNFLWTADYPHFFRQALEEAFPGALAVFVTGCTGDVNTGHSPKDSLKTDPDSKRTFAEAERIGRLLAESALAAPLTPVADGPVRACAADILLPLQKSGTEKPEVLAAAWRAERKQAPPERALLLDIWLRWAEMSAQEKIRPVPSRVSLIEWGGVKFIALPGEIFAATALDLRSELGPADFVISYAEDNPGYIPPESEYELGGYEMEEAHRYYGMPAAFAPGAAEALAAAARNLLRAQA